MLTLDMTWTDTRRHFDCTLTADHELLRYAVLESNEWLQGEFCCSRTRKDIWSAEIIPRDQKHNKLRIVGIASSVFIMHTR